MKLVKIVEQSDLEQFFKSNPGVTKKEFARVSNVTYDMIIKIIDYDINCSISMSERIIKGFGYYGFNL